MLKKDVLILKGSPITKALKQLNKSAGKVLIVVDDSNRLLGTISDGDIRRFMLAGGNFEDSVDSVYNANPTYVNDKSFSYDKIKSLLLQKQIELIPIINNRKIVVDTISWKEAFSDRVIFPQYYGNIDVPVVIMAGGKGTRLEPFTTILPKPLIPVGDKPILEMIMDEFTKFGVNKFNLIVNYKGEMIEAYFKSSDKSYELTFTKEDDFYGTAGSLKLLEKDIAETFIVSNCDVIVRANLEQVLKLHNTQSAYLTIISAIQTYKIPYGVINFKEQGLVTEIIEKPEHTFTINTGVYVLNKRCLEYIPANKVFNMTDLISKLMADNKGVFTYPINENDYIDIGQWDEYKKALSKLRFFA